MDDKQNRNRDYNKSSQANLQRDLFVPVQEDILRESMTAQQNTLRARRLSHSNLKNNENINSVILTRGLEDKHSPETEKKLGHRIYRLKGYTTVDKVKRKYQQQKYQRTLRSLLTTIIIVILLVILFVLYNPFKDIEEWKKITGMDGFLVEAETDESISEDGLPDLGP